MRHPQVLKLIMDSLRYWVTEMHVDGFRFDLAAALARELHDVDRLSAFFDIIHQDPIISQVKLIAEPWDVGRAAIRWAISRCCGRSGTGKYRDTVRRYWKGDEGQLSDLGYRLTGSSDLYQHDGRRPYASINFVTAHDGFTLEDLVSYNEKHNEANGENNQDGANDNHSWNMGVEGPTDDPDILAARERQKRNLLATLFLSQGVPMLCGGDEIGRTQRGNNNAYCQDNEISWFDWKLDERKPKLLEFTRRLIEFRRAHPNLRRTQILPGPRGLSPLIERHRLVPRRRQRDDAGTMEHRLDAQPGGACSTARRWARSDEMGEPLQDDSFLIMLNSIGGMRHLHPAAVAPESRLEADDEYRRSGSAFAIRRWMERWTWPAAPWCCSGNWLPRKPSHRLPRRSLSRSLPNCLPGKTESEAASEVEEVLSAN